MVDGAVDRAILAVSIIAALLGITMLASGEVVALAALIVGIAGFAYLKTDREQARHWIRSQRNGEGDPKEETLALLRRRYARGEIEQDEFERKLDDLLETETIERAEKRQEKERIRGRE